MGEGEAEEGEEGGLRDEEDGAVDGGGLEAATDGRGLGDVCGEVVGGAGELGCG